MSFSLRTWSLVPVQRRTTMCLIEDSKFFLAWSSHSWKRKEGLGLQTIVVLFGSTKGTVAILIHRINFVTNGFEFGSGWILYWIGLNWLNRLTHNLIKILVRLGLLFFLYYQLKKITSISYMAVPESRILANYWEGARLVVEKRYVCQQLVIALCGGINTYAESFLAQRSE
jgi:hypothetical protein